MCKHNDSLKNVYEVSSYFTPLLFLSMAVLMLKNLVSFQELAIDHSPFELLTILIIGIIFGVTTRAVKIIPTALYVLFLSFSIFVYLIITSLGIGLISQGVILMIIAIVLHITLFINSKNEDCRGCLEKKVSGLNLKSEN